MQTVVYDKMIFEAFVDNTQQMAHDGHPMNTIAHQEPIAEGS